MFDAEDLKKFPDGKIDERYFYGQVRKLFYLTCLQVDEEMIEDNLIVD